MSKNIDPPYNTGSDGFVYNDRFDFTVEEMMTRLSLSESQAQRVLDLTKRGSASHSAWLMFIYPRLQLARDLLSDDGVIFISIDDNEQANLKLICDDIFGGENFIANFIWEKTQHFGRQALNNYQNHDYILCYAKKLVSDSLKRILVEHKKVELEDAPLYNASNNICVATFPRHTVKFNMRDGEYKQTTSVEYELLNAVKVKDGWNDNDFSLKFRSRWSPETIINEIETGTHYWVKTANFAIRAIYGDGKISLSSPKNIIFTNRNNPNHAKGETGVIPGVNEHGTDEISGYFETPVFSYPKPLTLLKYLIGLLFDPCVEDFDQDATVLDFFSGSATTADAVMQLNAEDGGKRKFIMVQLPEIIEEGNPAYNAGYRTIDEIGRERIIRAAKKIKEENPDTTADLGFKHYVLEEPAGKQLEDIIDFDQNLNEIIITNNIVEEFGTDTVLTTWLVRDGYGFSPTVKAMAFGSYTGYHIDKHLYLIDKGLDHSAIEAIVTRFDTDPEFNPENVVLFGYSFTWTEMESLQTNLKRQNATEKNLRINFDIRY